MLAHISTDIQLKAMAPLRQSAQMTIAQIYSMDCPVRTRKCEPSSNSLN